MNTGSPLRALPPPKSSQMVVFFLPHALYHWILRESTCLPCSLHHFQTIVPPKNPIKPSDYSTHFPSCCGHCHLVGYPSLSLKLSLPVQGHSLRYCSWCFQCPFNVHWRIILVISISIDRILPVSSMLSSLTSAPMTLSFTLPQPLTLLVNLDLVISHCLPLSPTL